MVSTLTSRVGKLLDGHGWLLTAGLCLSMLSGCMVGPNYQPPQPDVPAHWAGPEPAATAALPDVDLARWWTVFDDTILSSLEDRAVRSNLNLMQAEARIRQARAARGIAASGLGPTVDATGAIQRSRSPGRSSNWQDGTTRGLVSNTYDAGFDAGWELDIFGGIRRNLEAADADLLASEESRRDVLVTLMAEVARNYIELRAFQQRIEIARENLALQQHTARLTRQRFEGGFVGGLDVANANAQVATTASQIPLLETAAPVHLCPQHSAGPGAVRPGSGVVPGIRHPGRTSRSTNRGAL